jgi:hypothetical protein
MVKGAAARPCRRYDPGSASPSPPCWSPIYIAKETRFGETVFCFEKVFTAAVHMIPSSLKGNADTSVLVSCRRCVQGCGCSQLSIARAQEGTGQEPSAGRITCWYATRESYKKSEMRSWRAEMGCLAGFVVGLLALEYRQGDRVLGSCGG